MINNLNMKKTFSQKDLQFVDLGLPSGILWSKEPINNNEELNWNEAMYCFGENIPTTRQFKEMINTCKLTWVKKEDAPGQKHPGYSATGPNGNSIFIPILENKNGYDDDYAKNLFHNICCYWTSDQCEDDKYAFAIGVGRGGIGKGLPRKKKGAPIGIFLVNNQQFSKENFTFVELGLPSGTLWGENNAPGFYTFDEARKHFPHILPTFEQFQELRDKCDWEWVEKKDAPNGVAGYRVIGPNGKAIFFEANGFCLDDKVIRKVDSNGALWSISTADDVGLPFLGCCLTFGRKYKPSIDNSSLSFSYNVRPAVKILKNLKL